VRATYKGNSKTRVLTPVEAFQEEVSWQEAWGRPRSAGKCGFSQVERTEARLGASRVELNWGEGGTWGV